MILEIVSLCVSSAVVIMLVINYFTNAFRNIRSESESNYRSVLKELSDIRVDIAKELSDIRVDIAKLQTTTDNIKSEIAIIRQKQIEIEQEVNTIRKDNDRGLQFNLFESRHAHAHLQLPDKQENPGNENGNKKND